MTNDADRLIHEPRHRLLAALELASNRLAGLYSRLGEAAGADRESLEEEEANASALADQLRDAYLARLPRLSVSRNPFSGEVLVRSIDIDGIDGTWWSYDTALRPREPLNTHPFAMTGAMNLAGTVEHTPFLVKPGPGVPFVIPRLLTHDQIAAVVSATGVGSHTGYLIVYYATEALRIERANEWGRNQYSYIAEDGSVGWAEVPDYEFDYDFDLADWIERGKLSWILPGDDELTLRSEIAGCPYLDTQGLREIQRIQEGEVWWPSRLREGGSSD